jgi:hypothetical protein
MPAKVEAATRAGTNQELKEYHMKHLAMTIAFTACLLSSRAFADNPTDAPLMPANTSAVQRENCAGLKRRHPNKLDQAASPGTRNENVSKKGHQKLKAKNA